MEKPGGKVIRPYKFLEEQRMKRKVQNYFDMRGKDPLKEEFSKKVFIHDIERDNFPETPIYIRGLTATWFETRHVRVDYTYIVFSLGYSLIYFNESGEWKSSRLFDFENSKNWTQVAARTEACLRYKDIVDFDTRPITSNLGLPHIYAYFQHFGTPFFDIRYTLDEDAPKNIYLDPAKQITADSN